MAPDIFQEVPQEDIPNLLKLFKQDLENYYPLCQYISIMEEYNKLNIKVPKQSLYRCGKIEDGAYLFKSFFNLGDTSYTLFHVYTGSKDLSNLEKALSQTERIPWFTNHYVFQVILKRYAPVIHKVAKDKGMNLNVMELDLLWLPPDQHPEKIKVPDDLDLMFLDASHAEIMDSQLMLKFPGSNKYLEIQITNNFGLGLFRKSDTKMVCYAVAYNSGGIFCLYTDPESRGKGYAEIIVQNMTKQLHLRQKIPFATVQAGNISSQKVFRKIGFKYFDKMEFISPTN